MSDMYKPEVELIGLVRKYEHNNNSTLYKYTPLANDCTAVFTDNRTICEYPLHFDDNRK